MKNAEAERLLRAAVLDLLKVIDEVRGMLIPERATFLVEACNAGEPGVALECLCANLEDLEPGVTPTCVVDEIARIGSSIGMSPVVWNALSPGAT